MRIGFRYDEQIRVVSLEENNLKGLKAQVATKFKKVNGGDMKPRKQNRLFYWRQLQYPLIEDKITKKDINNFWSNKGFFFPKESNCVGCFWKPDLILREQFITYPEKMGWFASQEEKIGKTFKKNIDYKDLPKMAAPLFPSEEFRHFSCNCTD